MIQTPATVRKKALERLELLKEHFIVVYNSANKYAKTLHKGTQLFIDVNKVEKDLLLVIENLDKSIEIIK